MAKIYVNGEPVNGSTSYASGITCVDKNGEQSTVQAEMDRLNSNLASSITTYKNPTSIPIKSGMQIILYANSVGTMTITMGAVTHTIELEDMSGCKWMLWIQTDERSGSLIFSSGTRQYMLTECIVEEAMISWTPVSSYTETPSYVFITIN